jgi:FeS assembly SUF system regulator
MLRLGRLTDYAITLLSHMECEGNGSLWAASGLSGKSGLPMPTAAKVLKLLAKGGLISAQRGATGGYKLARRASEISIAEIIETMDGPIAITDCSKGSAHERCKIRSLCPLSNGWNKVNLVLREALKKVSLAELLETPALLKKSDARLEGES